MADELNRIRVKFVDSVNKELIKELLDGLLEVGVLNDGQKDSILEENPSTKDKARALIDTVRRKGDVASRKMIALLQSRDQTLYDSLGLSSGKPAQPAAAAAPEIKLEQECSDTLIPSTKAFWTGKQGQRDTYPAAENSIRHRLALLITNITFTDTSLNRKGADRDEENMDTLLVALGYEVVKLTDLTGKEIDAAVIEFSKHKKLKETDSVVVVIMSHGKLGAVLGVGWKKDKPDEFCINNIYHHLGPERCPALLDKPKIILIQACRGEKRGSVLVKDGLSCDDASHNTGHEEFEEDGVRYVIKEKDFLALLSCTPDTVSYRQTDRGSLLIQYFVEVLNTSAHMDDIEELFRKVMQRFEDFSVNNKRQMPTKDRVTLTRRFYFFPGI
ncbi:caspase a-like isoform X1 [Pseudochaenichthys georgianus]|uniref:caspase a-like isoform X1 n=1 Tax=Pseudochaenichthys georgianus TaxID=52239 RepID=UPI00146CA8EA|nr:caspase a isoform X1 [Pseudochaenichthys georgianus]